MTSLDALTEHALRGGLPSRDDARAVLSDDLHLLDVVAAAGRVRRHHFGRRVRMTALVGLQGGGCPRDCAYCSQRRPAVTTEPPVWLPAERVAHAAGRAIGRGAARICLATRTDRPDDHAFYRIELAIRAVKSRYPGVEVCVGMGALRGDQAERLRAAGADAYNSRPDATAVDDNDLAGAHTFAERADTVAQVARSGMAPFSGAVFGFGESDDHVVDVAFGLRGLYPDAVPMDFLGPAPHGSRSRNAMTPQRCLRVLALFRFCFPDVEVILGAGRDHHLPAQQALGLHVADAVAVGPDEPDGVDDRRLILDAGFELDDVLAAVPA